MTIPFAATSGAQETAHQIGELIERGMQFGQSAPSMHSAQDRVAGIVGELGALAIAAN